MDSPPTTRPTARTRRVTRRATLALLAAPLAPRRALAAPRAYALDRAGSEVSFTFRLSGSPVTGTMPVLRADLSIDFARLAGSSAAVDLQASAARTALPFATDALKSPGVLDTAAHPVIRFRSRSVSGSTTAARIDGDVTIRGVTRPLALDARIYRRAGSDPGDLSRLTVILTGRIRRSQFGATGYADLVADAVDLRITARLLRGG